MRAVQITRLDGPTALEVVDVPEPEAGPGDPVRHRLARVCDWLDYAVELGASGLALATARRLVVTTDDGEWSVPGALTAWHAWEECRAHFPALADSPWVLPALRRGPGPASARCPGQWAPLCWTGAGGGPAAR